MPEEVDSLQAEKVFQEGFNKDLLRSLIVIIVRRQNREQGLLKREDIPESHREDLSDFEFIDEILKPQLEQLLVEKSAELTDPEDQAEEGDEQEVASRVVTFSDNELGSLLNSADKKASLVLVELPNDFLDYRNERIIGAVEDLLFENPQFRKEVPAGLDLALSGSATVGRDMLVAEARSAEATEMLTVVLVVALLIIIYRAPVLAFIPLITVAVSLQIVLSLIALLAQAGVVGAFASLDVYVTVITYGAGVDYCLFLISRYKEALDEGATTRQAVSLAVSGTGPALAGSAGTSVVGIGMMVFADFEKFQQAGVGISLGLIVSLIAVLTFTPTLLRLTGRYAFWPNVPVGGSGNVGGWISPTKHWHRIVGDLAQYCSWQQVSQLILNRPGQIWLAAIALMTPFAIIACVFFNHLSYGLMSELPERSRSVVGTKAIQEHFPAGSLGPTTFLLVNEEVNFTTEESIDQLQQLTESLHQQAETLEIYDIRSLAYPLGVTEAVAEDHAAIQDELENGRPLRRNVLRRRIVDQYVGNTPELGKHITRLDVIFDDDPFDRDSISQLETVEQTLIDQLPEGLAGNTKVYALGPTASNRDLKRVTDADQIRVDILVLVGVYLVLVALLRKPAISVYLIVSVFFSYLVTLGVTFAVFWSLDPWNFAGIDWKVRMFLFTILIAIGEDYNIFLMTRIDEESETEGPVNGVTSALSKTGSIISSCGVIMAGTFCSLMAGSLQGMVQLGFALAFGVFLDTFLVRPILVPAYLVMLHRGYMGKWGPLLGAKVEGATELPAPDTATEQ